MQRAGEGVLFAQALGKRWSCTRCVARVSLSSPCGPDSARLPYLRAWRYSLPVNLQTHMSTSSLDILAIAAHRDDVEQTCGGTLLKMAERGHRTGILDLTQGEMGTRGTAEDRAHEAEEAAKIPEFPGDTPWIFPMAGLRTPGTTG